MTDTATELQADASAPAPSRRARFFERFPRAKPMLVLTAFVLVLNVVTVRHVTYVSAIDEQYYIDHLIKAANFQIDQSGDRIDQRTLVELCHRGAFFTRYPACKSGHQNARKFVLGGVNAVTALPLYFFATGVTARALQVVSPIALPPEDSLVTWGRLLGAAWLLLGCYFTLCAADLLGVRRRLVVIALVLAVGTPALLHATTIINPDASAFAAGAGVFLGALAWEQRKVGLWAPLVAAFIAAALKLPNTVAMLIVLLYFVGRGIESHVHSAPGTGLRPWVDYFKTSALMLVAAVVAIRGWNAAYPFLQEHLFGNPDTKLTDPALRPVLKAYKANSLSLKQVFGEATVTRMLPPIDDIAPPPERAGGVYGALAIGAKYLFVTPLFGILLVGRRFGERLNIVTVATFSALLLAPVFFVLYWYYVSGTHDDIVARYGLSAMPALVILLAATAARGRIGVAVLSLAAAGMYVGALGTNFV